MRLWIFDCLLYASAQTDAAPFFATLFQSTTSRCSAHSLHVFLRVLYVIFPLASHTWLHSCDDPLVFAVASVKNGCPTIGSGLLVSPEERTASHVCDVRIVEGLWVRCLFLRSLFFSNSSLTLERRGWMTMGQKRFSVSQGGTEWNTEGQNSWQTTGGVVIAIPPYPHALLVSWKRVSQWIPSIHDLSVTCSSRGSFGRLSSLCYFCLLSPCVLYFLSDLSTTLLYVYIYFVVYFESRIRGEEQERRVK